MFVGFAFLLAVSQAPSDTCAKLADDFDKNEWMFAFSHDLNASMLDIKEESAKRMAVADQNLAMAEARARAVGAYVAPRSTRDPFQEVKEARQKLEETDRKHKEEGDRITNLLIANKCQPPDHVTTWYTYSNQNPNRKELKKRSVSE